MMGLGGPTATSDEKIIALITAMEDLKQKVCRGPAAL